MYAETRLYDQIQLSDTDASLLRLLSREPVPDPLLAVQAYLESLSTETLLNIYFLYTPYNGDKLNRVIECWTSYTHNGPDLSFAMYIAEHRKLPVNEGVNAVASEIKNIRCACMCNKFGLPDVELATEKVATVKTAPTETQQKPIQLAA